MSDDNAPTPNDSSVVRVWDLPTRLFHWLLAVAVVAQVTTGMIGGAALTWHLRVGYCVFALILFRVVWGLVGGHWSRFATFIWAGERAALRAGLARSVIISTLTQSAGQRLTRLMLVMLAIRAIGLVADDDRHHTGPLNRYVSSAFALSMTAWHKGPASLILALRC
jgi:cytochrome b